MMDTIEISNRARSQRETKSRSNKYLQNALQYQTSDSKFVQDKMSTIPVDFLYEKSLNLARDKWKSTYSDRENIC
jgi:hypothetical protein